MLPVKSILIILLVIPWSLSLYSQINNLEILDHSEHRTILTSFIYNDGDVIYVVENDERGFASTQVKVSKNKEVPQNLLIEELHYRSNSKWFYDSNGNIRVYLFGFSNAGSDDYSADFIEVKEKNNIYTSKRINNPFMISLEAVTSIAIDSFDNIYTITNYPRIQQFENDTLKNQFFPNISSESQLHTNNIGEVYLLDSGIDTIFKVNALEMEFVNTLDLDVKEAKNINNGIWILDEDNKLYKYETDFQGLPQEIPLTFSISSLDQISEYNSKIYFLKTEINGFKIFEYDSNSFIELSEYQEDFGRSDKLYSINDSLFLTSGQFEIDLIANHAFIRGYNINQKLNPSRAEVSLKDFELFYLKDTIISGAPEDLWSYGVHYTLENSGSSDIMLSSIYTSHLVPQFTSGHFLYEHQLIKTIIPNESIDIDTTKIIAYYHPSFAIASLTGSNYMFNESYTSIEIGITTSSSDLELSSQCRVFPNPFSSFLNIDSKSNQQISLYNSNGILIYTGDSNQIDNENFSYLNEGNYYLRFKESGQLIKLMKMNGNR